MRDCLLRLLVLAATAAALLTEILSPFHLVGRTALGLGWAALLAARVAYVLRHPPPRLKISFRPFETAAAVACAALVLPVALTAWLSPPNTFDALAYHMPRIVYWAQAGSVAFFPTPYLSQISAPPLAEYLMLHTYVLSGGDHWVNLVSVLAFVGCILGVSAVAAALQLNSRTQALAALLCATLPSAILQASGPKNDCLTALWLVAMVYFTLRRNLPYAALGLGLALATKGTAYLFAPPLAAATFWIGWQVQPPAPPGRPRRPAGEAVRVCAWMLAGILLLNTPQYIRNLRFSGSPLGYDAPFAGGLFRWRNQPPGWKPTVSNALRHLSEQLGSGNPRWNRGVYSAVIRLDGALGMDLRSPDSPWWSAYQPPANTRHEANANNRWHLLLIFLASLWAARLARRRDSRWLLYAAALAAAFLCFCWYLRWQPYSARLFLPLFVAAMPLAAAAAGRTLPLWALAAISLFFVDAARLPVLENWTRPLRGPHNLFTIPRDSAYFSDMPYPAESEAAYREAADRVARAGCRTVGIDIGENQLEYPFQALLRERDPRVRFQHAGVTGATLRYAAALPPAACAVFCLECAGRPTKLAEYSVLGPPTEMGRELLFLRPNPQR